MEDPDHGCIECPIGANCKGGNELIVNPEYWRVNKSSVDIIWCENMPINCLGKDICSEGHTGPLCEVCEIKEGYTRGSALGCNKCG